MCDILVYDPEGFSQRIALNNLRRMTGQQLKEKFPSIRGNDKVQLSHNGMTLNADSTPLSQYGIQKTSVIHLVLKVHGG